MAFSRRELLRTAAIAGAGAAALPPLRAMAAALAAQTPATPLVWVNEGGVHHDHLALLGQAVPSFLDLVITQWDLRDYAPLRPVGHAPLPETFTAAPVLIMEAIPAKAAPSPQATQRIAQVLPQAKTAVLLGTEACYGGIRTTAADVAAIEALCRKHKTPLIKLPGVPVPPHHLLGILSHLEFYGFPPLDGKARPLLYYRDTVCKSCQHRDDLETGRFAEVPGEAGCLLRLGCKGPVTHNSCSEVRWNGGENWCVGAGGPCTGCSEPGFPDHGGLGLYGPLSGRVAGAQSVLLQNLEEIGLGLLAFVGAGVAIHVARRLLAPQDDPEEPPGPGGREQKA